MKVYIGIGSNIGDRKSNFKKAISFFNNEPGVEVIEVSDFYDTKPVGGPPQENYLNGVLRAETELSPKELLKCLKKIEKEMGRISAEKDFPRIIDLDILLYGNECIREEELEVPHPRMHERSFVLEGMVQIAPGVIHPGLGKKMKELLCAL